MLQPTDRRLLFDALAPPTGFKLDFAVGTTYTLDLFALLSAPVAFESICTQVITRLGIDSPRGRSANEPKSMMIPTRFFPETRAVFLHRLLKSGAVRGG